MRIDPAIDQRTARLAERYFGYVTATQAEAVGHTLASLRTRTENGLLERRGRLYRVCGAAESWQGDAYAATANGSAGAVASAMTAAALYGWCRPPRRPKIIVPRSGNARSSGIAVHRVTLERVDVTRVGVIPATSPARTLVDCARYLGFDALCDIVDAAFISGLVTTGSVEAAIARASVQPGKRGLANLRRALQIWAPGMSHDSIAECRMFRLILAWGFDMPDSLYVIRDADDAPVCEVDAAWPDRRVALDYDSSLHHHPRRWPRDEKRATAAERLGWEFVPVDKTDLHPGGHTRFRNRLTELLAA